MSYEGISDQISLGKETVVGTAVTPTVSLAILPSDGIQVKQDTVGVEAMDTTPALNKDFLQGMRDYEGKFEMNCYPIALGWILRSAIGSPNTTAVGTETLVKKHTYSETVAKPSMTIEQKIDALVRRYAGFTVSGWSLEWKSGEPVKLSFEGKALSDATATAITASYETSKVFDWTDISSLTIGGTDVKASLDSFKIEYKNGLESFHALTNQPDPTRLYVKNSEVTGNISATLTSDMVTLRQAFLDSTNKEIILTLVADETIGNASNNTLVITCSRCSLNGYSTPIDTDYTKCDLDFVAGKDTTNGLIKVELTNLQASY
jgi:hypothetical protein